MIEVAFHFPATPARDRIIRELDAVPRIGDTVVPDKDGVSYRVGDVRWYLVGEPRIEISLVSPRPW